MSVMVPVLSLVGRAFVIGKTVVCNNRIVARSIVSCQCHCVVSKARGLDVLLVGDCWVSVVVAIAVLVSLFLVSLVNRQGKKYRTIDDHMKYNKIHFKIKIE